MSTQFVRKQAGTPEGGRFANVDHPEGAPLEADAPAVVEGSSEWFEQVETAISSEILAQQPGTVAYQLSIDDDDRSSYDSLVTVFTADGESRYVDLDRTAAGDALVELGSYDDDFGTLNPHERHPILRSDAPPAVPSVPATTEVPRTSSEITPPRNKGPGAVITSPSGKFGFYQPTPMTNSRPEIAAAIAAKHGPVVQVAELIQGSNGSSWNPTPARYRAAQAISYRDGSELAIDAGQGWKMSAQDTAAFASYAQIVAEGQADEPELGAGGSFVTDTGAKTDTEKDASAVPARQPKAPQPIFTEPAADITAFDPAARAALISSLQPKAFHHDGEYSTVVGAKYADFQSAADVAKQVRADLKAAQASRALPDGVTYTVRSDSFAGGQAIRITAMGLPDSALSEPDTGGMTLPHRTAESAELDQTLMAIGQAYDRRQSGMDLHNPTYFCSTTLESEHSREYREFEKAERAIQVASSTSNFADLAARHGELIAARATYKAAHPRGSYR